ncbi:class I adenylate-forming enzyme family protein [Cumulibacter soli]|uniref:class I adenylate-forming enzyme family protein n=1 Tax=Cumulibacter soli TaxID=2546344 RepID=UPI00141A279A|nr:AMP-binding protein [Cumulibacter soli]
MPALNLDFDDETFFGRDVPWLLRYRAEHSGDDEFLVWVPRDGNECRWTYAQFWSDVRRTANGLRARGVQVGDRIQVHSDNCPEMMLAWYACATLGAIAVTTNTRTRGGELTYFAEHSGAVGAITQPHLLDELKAHTPTLGWYIVIGADFDELLSHSDDFELREPDPLMPAGIQYTSGTTARPKAVIHTHANFLWGARTVSDNLRITPVDAYLTNMPLFHTHAQAWNVWPMIWAGGRVVLQPKFSASTFWDVVLCHNVTVCSMQAFSHQALSSQPVPKHNLRLFSHGARLPLIEQHYGVPTFSAYGMTETVSHVLRRDLMIDTPEGSIGSVTPGYQIAVIDESGKRAAPGVIGDLYVRGTRGVQLALGYFNNPEANAKAYTADGWFHTGDRVQIDAEGYVYFADRDKDVLRVGGENVSAKQVEQVVMLAAPGQLHSVAVIASPHRMLDEVPVVFIKLLDQASMSEDEVRTAVLDASARELADFKRPREVYFVEEMPTGLLDKIDKKLLRTRAAELAPEGGLELPTA